MKYGTYYIMVNTSIHRHAGSPLALYWIEKKSMEDLDHVLDVMVGHDWAWSGII